VGCWGRASITINVGEDIKRVSWATALFAEIGSNSMSVNKRFRMILSFIVSRQGSEGRASQLSRSLS
jgi:hypothetical protein